MGLHSSGKVAAPDLALVASALVLLAVGPVSDAPSGLYLAAATWHCQDRFQLQWILRRYAFGRLCCQTLLVPICKFLIKKRYVSVDVPIANNKDEGFHGIWHMHCLGCLVLLPQYSL